MPPASPLADSFLRSGKVRDLYAVSENRLLLVASDRLSAFETAVRYQMFHALALIAVGLGRARLRPRAPTTSGWLFVAGVVLFSGSLYALAVTGVRWWGAITPLGGLSFLAGWLVLMLGWTSRPAGDDRH